MSIHCHWSITINNTGVYLSVSPVLNSDHYNLYPKSKHFYGSLSYVGVPPSIEPTISGVGALQQAAGNSAVGIQIDRPYCCSPHYIPCPHKLFKMKDTDCKTCFIVTFGHCVGVFTNWYVFIYLSMLQVVNFCYLVTRSTYTKATSGIPGVRFMYCQTKEKAIALYQLHWGCNLVRLCPIKGDKYNVQVCDTFSPANLNVH